MAKILTSQPPETAEALSARLVPGLLPTHVGVIMDGNGRWGVDHGGAREYGHRESVDAMRTVVTAADDLGIKCLSLYCFSTENLDRPLAEVESLFKLFNDVLDTETQELHRKNTRILTSGFVEYLPAPLPEKFARACKLTAANTGLTLNLCVMYSGRSELIRAVQQLARRAAAGELAPAEIDEGALEQHLFQPGLPEIDLVIRTSGELRISNFLLWQMAYAELVFSEVLWPDYSRADFIAALCEYQWRQRRFGGVSQTNGAST
jgi:undecaprenyl diphosphate synthase